MFTSAMILTISCLILHMPALYCDTGHVKVRDLQADFGYIQQLFQQHNNPQPSIQNDDWINITPFYLQRATLTLGEFPKHVNDAILNQKCLNIVVIGGSNSCGRGNQNKPDSPHPPGSDNHAGKLNAFPALLCEYMNKLWPCQSDSASKPSNHTVTNMCEAGVGSQVWLQRLLGARNTGDPLDTALKQAHLVIVETSVNEDTDQLYSNDHKTFEHTEAIIKILSMYTTLPLGILYLGVGTRGFDAWSGGPRHSDAVHQHLNVTSYYKIPHLSIVDGLGPFVTDQQRNFFLNVYKIDFIHASKTGHKLIAMTLLRYLINYYHELKYPTFPLSSFVSSETGYAPVIKSLLYNDPERITQFLSSNPLEIKLNVPECKYIDSKTEGWYVYEDVSGKPGFIAKSTEEYFSLKIPYEDVKQHLKFGRLSITLLKSYEKMGVLKVTVSKLVSVGDGSLKQHPHGQSTLIDCLWSDHSSQQTVESINLNNKMFPNSLLDGNSNSVDATSDHASSDNIDGSVSREEYILRIEFKVMRRQGHGSDLVGTDAASMIGNKIKLISILLS